MVTSTSVSAILGRAKWPEIKGAFEEGRVVEYLRYLVCESDFRIDDETLPAYRMVATFLEDGWREQQSWIALRGDCSLSLDEFGRIMNSLVRGTRYEERSAEEIGCPWTLAGPWPTSGDLAAFLFYCAVDP